MGEVKIKSGNLFDIEHYIDTAIIHNMEITPIKNGIRLTSTSSNDPYCDPSYWGVGITVPLDMRKSLLPCKPSTKYTIMLNQTVTVRKIVSYVDENFTSIQNFTNFDGEVANIQTPENCTYIIFRIGNESTMPEGTTVEVTNIQLLEGTYTSETIPEYQPYFLNKPAHQFVNGQWVDIPTHHYTNGRWQGELTSQSPLKFRADGEMLDWRIDGKTSGNLFDVNGDIARESSGSIEISENQIIITVTAAWGRDYIIYDKIFNPGLYTIKIISSSNTSEAPYSVGFLSTTPLPGWKYNEYYAAYVKDFDKNNTLIIRTTESMRIGFRCISSQTGQKVTLSNIKILEGAYTPETIPEDEPYGVGNWDETVKKYKIPIWVEGKNLFDGEWKQGTILSPSSENRVSNKNAISLKTNTVYTIGVRGSSIIQYALVYRDRDGKVTYDSGWLSMTDPVFSSTAEGTTAEILIRRSDAGSITPVSEEILNLKVIFIEGAYISSTIPLYEVNLYTDHQLLDGDSIDFSTDQTQIPLATGNNTLTVDTAVQPSKVFVKFEG